MKKMANTKSMKMMQGNNMQDMTKMHKNNKMGKMMDMQGMNMMQDSNMQDMMRMQKNNKQNQSAIDALKKFKKPMQPKKPKVAVMTALDVNIKPSRKPKVSKEKVKKMTK